MDNTTYVTGNETLSDSSNSTMANKTLNYDCPSMNINLMENKEKFFTINYLTSLI